MTAHINHKRLAQLLGMIGSDHDGEALSFARKAHAMVKSAGATWDDVISGSIQTEPQFVEVTRPPDIDELLRDIQGRVMALNDKERDFISDVISRRRTGWKHLTPAQARWIKIIAVKQGIL